MAMAIQGLSHRPRGIEHPYQQEPDERFPRQPLAGQPVELGLRTWPAGAATRVWATWRIDKGQPETVAEARITAQGVSASGKMEFATSTVELGGGPLGDIWRVSLPAFSRGQQVEYQVHAVGQGEPGGDTPQLDSPIYSFVAVDWISAGVAVGYHLTADGVEIMFRSPEGGLETRLALSRQGTDQLGVTLRAGGADTSPGTAADPAGWQVKEQTEVSLALAASQVTVDFHLEPFRLQISRTGKTLLTAVTPPEWLVGRPGDAPRSVRWSFDSPEAEGFYGLGERFHALNQRHTAPEVQVFEQYKNQGIHTYIPVSFLLSSRGYAFFLDSARRACFDLAATRADCWSFAADLGPVARLDIQLYTGASPLANLRLFSRQLGLPKLPPDWVFGPWMSSNEWNSQATVMEQVRQTLSHHIPATVLVIEAWSDEKTFYIWNDARYSPNAGDQAFCLEDFTFPPDGLWPDPKAMIDELHRQGIRLILWQIPIMKDPAAEPHPQLEADAAYLRARRYCLHEADGTPYRVRPFWFHGSLLLDVSNPEAVDWWMSKRAYLLDELGVDGFKTDGGEHLWGSEVVFANGMRGDEGQNLYPNLYVGAYHRFASQKRNGDAVTFSRAGFTGAQAFPCHWAGDENSTWEAFRASLLAGLNAGLSGIPFWGWDLAGFSGEIPNAELFLRAAAMAAFCPIMQYHSEYNEHRQPLRDRTPWNIAERTGRPDVIEIYRQFAQLRMRLLPYITQEAKYCAETGEPLMRPLFLDWPTDPQAWLIADQYSFGRALLVAPVLQPGATERRLYLPEGRWLDFWEGGSYAGSQWLSVPAPLDRIPVFRRLEQPWTELT